MLTAQPVKEFNDENWQRINMRSVSHLLGAEMLHNLYNRHWPRINSLRFRHTVTLYKNGFVESYAPVEEWQYLQNWLSKKFVSCDAVLIREIEAIMNTDYSFTDELIERLKSEKLDKLSNEELGLLLIDVMDFSLGDIYKLNVVQIEYSLNYAIHNILERYEPSAEDRNLLLSKLISPGELTVSQIEEVAFGKIVSQFLRDDKVAVGKKPGIHKMIVAHHRHFAPTHCAYGENPPSIDDYENKLKYLVNNNTSPVDEEEAWKTVRLQAEKSAELLERIADPNLASLCALMGKIGVFRDKNKAKLGETIPYRLTILNEISRRTGINRGVLNLYIMSELTALLENNQSVSKWEIDTRLSDGVAFIRNEEVVGYTPLRLTKIASNKKVVNGICASPGLINGHVKIVFSKEDIHKVTPTDIMVAIGTDFDLLEVMNVCAGIITEEGGLLSHASVVSRELKKPCLIGVSNATKIFKDGDSIQLDADGGKIIVELQG